MAEKYQNKYRIASARLAGWDYGRNAAYFVTICTQNRQHFFGEVVADEMQLSSIGRWAQQYWQDIPLHFPFVRLGEFVVMPNHVHGIIIIDKPDTGSVIQTPGISVETPKLGVSTATNHRRATNAVPHPCTKTRTAPCAKPGAEPHTEPRTYATIPLNPRNH